MYGKELQCQMGWEMDSISGIISHYQSTYYNFQQPNRTMRSFFFAQVGLFHSPIISPKGVNI